MTLIRLRNIKNIPYVSAQSVILKRSFHKSSISLNTRDTDEDDGKKFIHDYSVFPQSAQLRLPSEDANENTHSNVLRYVMEQGGVETMNYENNQRVFQQYPLTNSKKLSRRKERPISVKLLASDFIEDSLYNPNYGYFSKEAVIFHPEKPFEYQKLQGQDEFMAKWLKAYDKYDQETLPVLREQERKSKATKPSVAASISASKSASSSASVSAAATAAKAPFGGNSSMSKSSSASKQSNSKVSKFKNPTSSFKNKIKFNDDKNLVTTKTGNRIEKPSLQLWHTPTELFQPYYGEALARYILVNYKLNQYPYHDLVIYEMGGGNGTLMMNILNFIKERQPEVYERTRYKIIEVSSQLAEKQMNNALQFKMKQDDNDHSNKVEIINKSIFEWNKVVPEPCFFIALEVFDNFAHDVVRYDVKTKKPYQGYVVVDERGDFKEVYSPKLDDWTELFLELREAGKFPQLSTNKIWGKHPLDRPLFLRNLKNALNPLRSGLSDPEYIPSRLLHFFQILKYMFPQHQLLASDFTTLPDSAPGYNSPVVQTMYKDRMVTCDSYMVHQGYFDIMFPTDFELISDMYRQLIGKISQTHSHKDFLEIWADVEVTTTKTGENPMLDLYENAAFLTS
ncbi:hypothetical protein B5S29_g3098 [[Candida] boidinii]|nr:hypothetical protein B5S29_g3098 [[Candida] boidinii]